MKRDDIAGAARAPAEGRSSENKCDGVKNVAASIRARLTNHARQTGRPFQEVLIHFTLERFLYRLSRLDHAGRFILKGGLLLRAWEGPQSRPTRDIDLLSRGEPSVEALVHEMQVVCGTAAEPDGLTFDPATVRGEHTRPDEEYLGVQIHLVGYLGQARTALKVDVGFGDTVIPGPIEMNYPTILDLPAPRLRGYTKESMVAEKFHAMVALGEVNSRFKDFYDVWFLAQLFDFDAAVLASAIRATFERRGTELPRAPLPLTAEFAADSTRNVQWHAFLRRTGIPHAPKEFPDVVAALRRFLLPTVDRLYTDG